MNTLALPLGILLFSFLLTSVAIVPFINLLYFLKFQRLQQQSRDVFGSLTPVFNLFHRKKAGVPVGGGLLIITAVSLLFAIMLPLLRYFGINITSVHRDITSEVNIL
ncbi:MAG: hypothetical protein COY81_01220, partial [Candidatus Pacebacteria bacterium CG_4_10_14_0_8_um_filter_43_12]